MIKVTHVKRHGNEHYESEDGRYVIAREDGLTPFGNAMNMRWVFRDNEFKSFSTGRMIDFDKYRNDLFERNDIIVDKER